MIGNLDEHQNKNCSHDEWLTTTQALISDVEQEISRTEETRKRAEERLQALQDERSYLQAAIDSYYSERFIGDTRKEPCTTDRDLKCHLLTAPINIRSGTISLL
jgi:chromosome segregation ATPase